MTENPSNPTDKEVLNPELVEIISRRPAWIIRHGITVIFTLVCLLGFLSWCIRYPDTIKGSLKIVAINAPKLQIATKEGTLSKILVANEQLVKKGDYILFLSSTAKHEQVINLRRWISQIESLISHDSLPYLYTYPPPLLYELGEVQPAYQEFYDVYQETLDLFRDGYYPSKAKALQWDIFYLSDLGNIFSRQKQLIDSDFVLQQTDYHAKEQLASEKILAPLEFNQEKSRILSKQMALEQVNLSMVNSNMSKHMKSKELLELHKTIGHQKQTFSSGLLTLKSNIDLWIREHIAIAPETGTLLYVSFLQEGQYINASQDLFYVQPSGTTYYGQLLMAQNGLGKVHAGQQVIIKPFSYPSSEFGHLRGYISFISMMPTSKDSFLVKVDMPAGLTTNSHRTLQFRNNLSSEAEVITDSRRLSDRLIGSLKIFTKQ